MRARAEASEAKVAELEAEMASMRAAHDESVEVAVKAHEESVMALKGEEGIVECTFVDNDLTAAPFFSTPCTLGVNGVEEVHEFGELTAFEQENFDAMLPDLISQAEKGTNFVKNM